MSNNQSQNRDTRKDMSATNSYIFPKAYNSMEIKLQPIEIPKFNNVDDERIKLACYEYAETLWFSEKGFVKKMMLTSKTESYALHYTLESFEETKEKVDSAKPYRGEHIDGPKNGSKNDSSSIGIEIPEIFEDGLSRIEIPHSRYVKVCFACAGHGVEKCPDCKGSRCDHCDRTGRSSSECKVCQGQKKLLHYEEEVVKRKKHFNDYVYNVTSLPSHLIQEAPGTQLFSQENSEISPMSHCPIALINEASREFVGKHRRLLRNKGFLLQRQTLRAVPITLVNYTSKGRAGEFFVYGSDNQAYFQYYPRQYYYIM